jgi:hypothetical protein
MQFARIQKTKASNGPAKGQGEELFIAEAIFAIPTPD